MGNLKLRKFIVFWAFVYVAWAGNAFAAPIEFQFDPGTAALSGVFSYDFDTRIYSDAQIIGSEATYCCDIMVDIFGLAFSIRDNLPVAEHNLVIYWDRSAVLTPEGGAYTGLEFLGCGGDLCSDRVWRGTVSPVNAVPTPAAAWLFGSALLGLVAVKRKKA